MLVLGKDDRSVLAILRSLGRAGYEVELAWHDPRSIVPRSRYCHATHELTHPDEQPEGWFAPLEGLLARGRYALVVPADDPSTLALAARRDALAARARLALPNPLALDVAFDKLRTWELARGLALPVPRQLTGVAADGLEDAARELGWPVVLKPRSAWRFGSRKWEHAVKKAYHASELRAQWLALAALDEVLLQENVPGRGVGVEVLAWEGELLLAFQHERLHEPPRGGGSSYRRSVALDRELLAATRALCARLELSGVAMVEFRREKPSGRWWLIEINARFWGSLPLALRAGADFPRALVEAHVAGARRFPQTYRARLTSRNLRRDAWWLLENQRTDPRDPTLARVGAGELARELGAIVTLREGVDAWAWDDPRPGALELARLARDVGRLAIARAARAPRTWAALRAGARSRDRARSARRVLFVCKGNLCRSPFAEHLLRARARGLEQVASAGYWREDGRPCPPEAVVAAEAHGLDLSAHRSRRVSEEDLERAEVVLVFDDENRRALAELFPRQRHKLVLLPAAAGQRPVHLPDPWAAGYDRFAGVFQRIASAVDALWLPAPEPRSTPSPVQAVETTR